jgi:hypothetical protein
MAKADVLALVATLADSVSSATQVSNYYDDAVYEMANGALLEDTLSLTDAAFVAIVEGTGVYTFPTALVRALAIHYDARDLLRETRRGAELYARDWRATRAQPAAYVLNDEDERTLSLVPVPDTAGQALGILTPFSATFPAENLMFIYTEERDDVHLDEELPLTLEVLGREMARDSDHHDATMADLAKKLATLLFALIHRKA